MIKMKKIISAALAAAMLLAGCAPQAVSTEPESSVTTEYSLTVTQAQYPDFPEYVNYLDYEDDWDAFDQAHEAYWTSLQEIRGDGVQEGYTDTLKDFVSTSSSQLLTGSGGKNVLYSPVNLYMALAMLAEITDDSSRSQVLELLGQNDVTTLRQQSQNIWRQLYLDDGVASLVLGNSLWLNRDFSFHQSTLDTLAENYYASSFQGKFGSDQLNDALSQWLSDQTGGLLEDLSQDIQTQPVNEAGDANLMMLLSTVYFHDQWATKFNENYNQTGTFTTGSGEEVQAEYMTAIRNGSYTAVEGYTASSLRFEQTSSMLFILPDEGKTVDDIINDGVIDQLLAQGFETYGEVDWMLPKFDVSCRTDLEESLQAMGITDVFDMEQSDFSPLTDTPLVYISKAVTAARVKIDEKGCEAASFVEMEAATGAAMPQGRCEMHLTRPFVFVITGVQNVPLFIGVVNQPG